MGKILLVEPSRILRQAIGLFLSPENEVRTRERIEDPKTEPLDGYDLLIFDRPELSERGWWSPELEASVQKSGLPVLWLEEENGAERAAQGKQLILKKPVLRESLRAAAASFLKVSAPETKRIRRASPPDDKSKITIGKDGPEESPRAMPQPETPKFIDLVDAVEEEPPPAQPKSPTKK